MARHLMVDLCCKAGGAAMGYHRAGFDVIGIDLEPQPHYPFEFVQMDAMDWLTAYLDCLDFHDGDCWGQVRAIHASPPCQLFTPMRHLSSKVHVDLITPMRPLLQRTGLPWVMENVPGAPLSTDSVILCGSMMDPPLDVRRHRLFETSWGCPQHDWPCRHRLWAPRFPSEDRRMTSLSKTVGVYGGGRYKGSDALRKRAMGIDWMTREELTQAVPPAYTEWIGSQLMAIVESERAQT